MNTVTAEGAFSVSFSSTRIGNIATGYSLTIVGESGTIENKNSINVSNGYGISGTFGTDDGIILSSGKVKTRTYHGDMVVSSDPLYDLFQRMVVIQFKESNFAKLLQTNQVGKAQMLSSVDAKKLFFEKLGSGDIKGFLQGMIGDTGVVNINMDKANDSTLLKAMSENGSILAKGDSIRSAFSFFASGAVMSIGDIFANFVEPFGLELYWTGGSNYSLEESRLAVGPTKVAGTIEETDIIELRSASDPYNIPDIIIPSTEFRDAIGGMGLGKVSMEALKAGIIGNVGGNNARITTFDIPNILVDPVMNAMKAIDTDALSYSAPHSKHTIEDSATIIAGFFGSHARKSTLYRLKTGQCTTVFRPDLVEGFQWYDIDGEKVFVSEIHHNISRDSATTTLIIAGKETEIEQELASTSTPEVDLKDEDDLLKKVTEAAKRKEPEILRDRESGKESNLLTVENGAKKFKNINDKFIKKEEKNEAIADSIISPVYS